MYYLTSWQPKEFRRLDECLVNDAMNYVDLEREFTDKALKGLRLDLV